VTKTSKPHSKPTLKAKTSTDAKPGTDASNPARPNANPPNANWPNLNWKEIQELAARIGPELEGLFLERIVVPSRPRYPQGYLKGEWALRFTGRRTERTLLLSVRPKHTYFALYSEKGPQAATVATHSPFDLAISKQLKGLKLIKVWVPKRERMIVLDFQASLRLALFLVPTTPEALLVQTVDDSKKIWPVIYRSRTFNPKNSPKNSEETQAAENFHVPDGSRAPLNLDIRAELTHFESLLPLLDRWMEEEAFQLRTQNLDKTIREKIKLSEDRIRQSEVALTEAREEPDWQRYADLLKSVMGSFSPAAASEREVIDYETGDKITIPGDPKLSLKEQIEKFYRNSRRNQRRKSEAENRVRMFTESQEKLEKAVKMLGAISISGSISGSGPLSTPDWRELEKLEQALGDGPRPSSPESTKRKNGSWLGKSAVSKDGWTLWIGRNKDENLELTFKHARGNDLWLHVRGRPGSHVVIPVQPGKTVPLETLLDAANLVVYYSGGETWGKTEVDYTFKKHVKRIKDSSEASYVHNKTLTIQPDKERLKRLLPD
jgi:predicted ribosome quality control (RQC) complex YloA/Tae2 family protein